MKISFEEMIKSARFETVEVDGSKIQVMILDYISFIIAPNGGKNG